MDTVQGGVPPYGVKETLVVNGGKNMKGCNACKLHGGILFKFILYLVLLQFPQLE